MIVSLRDVEPFNVEPVSNGEAAMFFQRLNGSQTFELNGSEIPKSMMINSLKFALPRHSFANGYLLSVDIDTFMSMCNNEQYQTMEPIMKSCCIGTIGIEMGGNLSETQISARELRLR